MNGEVLRILDANLNRAREALRVIEDCARFVCRDAAAAAATKQLRHDLRPLSAALDAHERLAQRDAAGDVGRERPTAAEVTRADVDDVVGAAFARLTEALRSIAEYGKLLDPGSAALAEALRFRAYELEQHIRLRSATRARFAACPLYVLITEAECRQPWLAVVDQLLAVGPIVLQLREKSLPDAELLRRARMLRARTRSRGALFIVNDRPDIARLAEADGVHVGQDDFSVAEVRAIGSGRMLVGRSTHAPEQVDAVIAENPDYIAIGPMFASRTKPQDLLPGPALLATAAARTQLPLVAIGGIEPEHAAALFAAGASSVCVCAAVLGAVDPAATARRFLDAAVHRARAARGDA